MPSAMPSATPQEAAQPLNSRELAAHSPRTPRAQAHRLTPWLLGCSLLLAACDPQSASVEERGAGASAASGEATSDEEVRALVDRLVEVSTPLDPTLTSDHHDRQLHAWKALREELRSGSQQLGHEALARFESVEASTEEVPVLVRVNLLDVAAHAATEETQPLLEELTLEYGHKMDIRTEAMLLLGEVAPARAVELLGPLLTKKRTSTMPADEFMLKAYVTGCEGSDQDPVPVLVDVATNIFKEDAARHRAVQELGEQDSRIARQALRAILLESNGNAYLRRKAAQAVKKSMPREEACALFREVAKLEADFHFQAFLEDMIQDNCE